MLIGMLSTVEYLEQSNRNIALHLRNNPDICFQIYLDMDLETALHILTLHSESRWFAAELICAVLGESAHSRNFGHWPSHIGNGVFGLW